MYSKRQSLSSLLQEAYLHACSLDVHALKPGNVRVASPIGPLNADHFLRSSEVSIPYLLQKDHGLGERIYNAISATHDAVGTNTNLGIVLLCAPFHYHPI